MRRAKKNIIIVLILLVASSITQCAPKPQIIKEDDEATLRRRIQEYWSYKIKGEWERCYLYESPAYRGETKIHAYIIQNARFPMKWEGYEIKDLWTSNGDGHIKLHVKYRYLMPKIQERGVFGRITGERWEKKDGQWYRVSEEAH